MMIQNLMKKQNLSKYRLFKNSGIHYTILTDICSGRAQLQKCSAETIYKLAKEQSDVDFIIDTLEKEDIRRYYDRQWYPESFYLLAMLDYVSRENDIALYANYSDLRSQKLSEPVFPSGIVAVAALDANTDAMETAPNHAIPKFLQFNTIENEVRNVI